MKKYFVLAAMAASFLFGFNAQAYTDRNDELECTEITKDGGYRTADAVAVSCVSKASIERDKLQIKLIKLQIKELEAKMKKDAELEKLMKEEAKAAK